MLPKYILSLENNKRAEMIAHKIGKIKNIDVATFNEGIDSESRNILINNLKKYNFFYHSNVVDINNIYNNGGIFIVSKFPILSQDIYIFKNSSGSDSLANKGILYSKIDIKGHIVNIFTTHLQAWPEAYKIRKRQIHELLSFAKNKNISKKEIVIITGDFNQSFKEIKADSNNSLINVEPISRQIYTFDYKNNSLAEEETREILDYILLLKGYKKPSDYFSKILKFKTVKEYNIDIWNLMVYSKSFLTKDLSDHYPVIGVFEF